MSVCPTVSVRRFYGCCHPCKYKYYAIEKTAISCEVHTKKTGLLIIPYLVNMFIFDKACQGKESVLMGGPTRYRFSSKIFNEFELILRKRFYY